MGYLFLNKLYSSCPLTTERGSKVVKNVISKLKFFSKAMLCEYPVTLYKAEAITQKMATKGWPIVYYASNCFNAGMLLSSEIGAQKSIAETRKFIDRRKFSICGTTECYRATDFRKNCRWKILP
jgi:hypothetical protein